MDEYMELSRNLFQRFAQKRMERRADMPEEIRSYYQQIPFLKENSMIFPNAALGDCESIKNHFLAYWSDVYHLEEETESLERIWEQSIVSVYHDEFLPCIILKNKGYITLDSMEDAMEKILQLRDRGRRKGSRFLAEKSVYCS